MSEHDGATQPLGAASSGAVGGRRLPRQMVRLLGYVAGVALVVGLAGIALALATTTGGKPPAVGAGPPVDATPAVAWQRPAVSDAGLADRIGVRIIQVAVTGGGGLVDLRFQVVDPSKAGAVHEAATPPAVVDEATGVVVNEFLMGHSHTDPFKAGQTYYLIFQNPGNLVQRGSTVSVLLGDAEVDHVTVR